MRLLLDEHYSPTIAQQLRERGHDVESVKERPELVGIADDDLLARMRVEGRTIVTEDVADFLWLVGQLAASGAEHAGVVLTAPRRFPRSTATIGMFVRSLDALLTDRPADASDNQVIWLIRRR